MNATNKHKIFSFLFRHSNVFIIIFLLACLVMLAFISLLLMPKYQWFLVTKQEMQHIEFFYTYPTLENNKKQKDIPIRTLFNLQNFLKAREKTLQFGMNAGMFEESLKPLGLYIENGKEIVKLNERRNHEGNFYLEPNGVFFITKNHIPYILATKKYKEFIKTLENKENIKFATQSGPILIENGIPNKAITRTFNVKNIRNIVCLSKERELRFGITTIPRGLFQTIRDLEKEKCYNALYLDGSISQFFDATQQKYPTAGEIGPMIALTK